MDRAPFDNINKTCGCEWLSVGFIMFSKPDIERQVVFGK